MANNKSTFYRDRNRARMGVLPTNFRAGTMLGLWERDKAKQQANKQADQPTARYYVAEDQSRNTGGSKASRRFLKILVFLALIIFGVAMSVLNR